MLPVRRGFTAPAVNANGAATSPASTQVGDLVMIGVWSQGTAIPTHAIQGGGATYQEIRSHSHNDGTTDGRLSLAVIVATSGGAVSYQPYAVSGATAGQTIAGIVVLEAATYDAVLANWIHNSVTQTTNAVPNPASVAGLTGDFQVQAWAAWHVTTAASTATTPPANYTEVTEGPSGSHVTHMSIAARDLAGLSAATEDPGAFGDNVTPNGTASITVAIPGFALTEITGTMATASAAQLADATGAVGTSGAAATSAAAQVADGVGAVGIAATSTTASAAQVAAGVGSTLAERVGTFATVAAAQVASAAGAVGVAGSMATSSAPELAAAIGAVGAAGAMGTASAAQIADATGAVGASGVAATAAAAQATATAATAAIAGVMATAAPAQVFAAIGDLEGSLPDLIGTMATATAAQVAAAVGAVGIAGSAATAAEAQVASIEGTVAIVGVFATVAAAQVAEGNDDVAIAPAGVAVVSVVDVSVVHGTITSAPIASATVDVSRIAATILEVT